MRPTIEKLPGGTLRTLAPAKVNLGLRITGRRVDGYHILDSHFAFADIGDILTARPADDLALEITGPFADGLDPDLNSVIDAARSLRLTCNVRAGASLTLEKNLPIASGIGGGSADAAATLRLLCALWGVRPSNLHEMASWIGADVPSCLESVPCHVAGIGEILKPVAAPRQLSAILVNPGVKVSTPAVFKKYRDMDPGFSAPADATSISTGNDLLAPALAICPSIADVLQALTESGPTASGLSGSGATCFGLYRTKAAAEKAAAGISEAHPHWWVRATELSA